MHNTAMEQEICQYSESVAFFNCMAIKEVSYLKENSQLSMTLKNVFEESPPYYGALWQLRKRASCPIRGA